MTPTHACTITSRRYAAQARVLADSFLEHHPGGRFSVLTVDGLPDALREAEGVEFLDLADVGIDELEANRRATMYPILGFTSGFKPDLLRALLARGEGPVVYVDADGCIYDDLASVVQLAERHSLVLSPHLLEADFVWRPDDSVEEALIAKGAYNSGFVAVGAGAEPFLDWWAQRTARRCVFDSASGHGIDQSPLTVAATLFDHALHRDRGCNVAAWNIQRRDVEWEGHRPTIDGGPLRHFHFAYGFDPRYPEQLAPPSEHAQPLWFPRLEERPGVARLSREYAQRLLARGYRDARNAPVAYATTPGGEPLQAWMRSVYSVAIIRAERDGAEEPPNPFTHGDERFLEWVRSPQPPEVTGVLAPRDNLLARISELEQIRDEAIAWAEREGDARQEAVAERDALVQQLEHARSVMTHVLSSPSWRLTRPLRSAKTAAKALRQVRPPERVSEVAPQEGAAAEHS